MTPILISKSTKIFTNQIAANHHEINNNGEEKGFFLILIEDTTNKSQQQDGHMLPLLWVATFVAACTLSHF